jgi:hypothetical protein
VEGEREEQPSTLHQQLHEILATVAACEAEWALDNRITLSLRLRAAR